MSIPSIQSTNSGPKYPSIVGARTAMIVGAPGFWLHADVSASPGEKPWDLLIRIPTCKQRLAFNAATQDWV